MRTLVMLASATVLLVACKAPEQTGMELLLEMKLPIKDVQATKLSTDAKTFCGTATLVDGDTRLFYAGIIEKRVYIEGEYGFTLDGYELRCETVIADSEKKIIATRSAERTRSERQKAVNSAAAAQHQQWLHNNQDAIRALNEATQHQQ